MGLGEGGIQPGYWVRGSPLRWECRTKSNLGWAHALAFPTALRSPHCLPQPPHPSQDSGERTPPGAAMLFLTVALGCLGPPRGCDSRSILNHTHPVWLQAALGSVGPLPTPPPPLHSLTPNAPSHLLLSLLPCPPPHPTSEGPKGRQPKFSTKVKSLALSAFTSCSDLRHVIWALWASVSSSAQWEC